MPAKTRKQTRHPKQLPQKSHQKPKTSTTKKPAPQPSANPGGFAASIRKKCFGRADAPDCAQQSIPYKAMYKDGICRVTDRLYTKTIVFEDITYQLAQNEDKTQIFESYCDFLNYFDSSVSVQLSFINQRGNVEEFQHSIDIPDRDDVYNSIRHEYSDMLKNQLAKGNNGLVKAKYITFGIEADSLKAAKPRMERVEADILSNFKTMGVKAHPLTGLERLEILHGQFHPDGQEKLRFSWKDIPKTGLSTKDFIAPTSFTFKEGKTFRIRISVIIEITSEAEFIGFSP